MILEINILKLIFWIFWIGLTLLEIRLFISDRRKNEHFMISVIVFSIYLLILFFSIIAYGGIYWW